MRRLLFRNLASARERLSPPPLALSLSEAASGGAAAACGDAEAAGKSCGGWSAKRILVGLPSRRGRRSKDGEVAEVGGGEGGEVGGEVGGREEGQEEGEEGWASQEAGGDSSVGESARCGGARGEGRAVRHGGSDARDACDATGEGEGGGEGGSGGMGEGGREGMCGRGVSELDFLVPSGVVSVGGMELASAGAGGLGARRSEEGEVAPKEAPGACDA